MIKKLLSSQKADKFLFRLHTVSWAKNLWWNLLSWKFFCVTFSWYQSFHNHLTHHFIRRRYQSADWMIILCFDYSYRWRTMYLKSKYIVRHLYERGGVYKPQNYFHNQQISNSSGGRALVWKWHGRRQCWVRVRVPVVAFFNLLFFYLIYFLI